MSNVILILFSVLFGGIFAYKPLYCIAKSNNIKIEFKKYNVQLVLAFIIILGCLFRTVGIDSFPAGLNQDEASIGYEAFSLASYGIDRNGLSWPVHFISWGSGQNALYAYILIPFVKILGLSVLSLRLPMAIIGCVSIYVFYYLLKIILPKYAVIGTFIFAINPWHIAKSRWALEANIFPDIFLLGFLLFMIALNGKKIYFIFSGLVFGVATYSYGTSYFILPIFCASAIIILLIKKRIKIVDSIVLLGTIFIVSLPMILFVLLNYSEYESLEIFGITIPKLYQNRQTLILNLDGGIFASLLSNIKNTLEILFVQYDGLVWNGMPFFGLTYVISTPIMVFGIIKSLKDKNIFETPMHVWFFASIFMMLFIDANINRANILFIPMIYFTILGVGSLIDFARSKKSIQTAKILAVCSFSILFIAFGFCYFGEDNQDSLAVQFFDGAGDAMVYANDNFENVYVTDGINQPYITYLFYLQISPNEYLENREVINPGESFEYIESINNFAFKDVDPDELLENECYIAFAYIESVIDSNEFNIEKFDEYIIISKK